MKTLVLLISFVGLWGCHHQTKPQNMDLVDPQLTEQIHEPVAAEKLMADFAHRY